jgi:HlyD family secretion protein
MTEMIPAWQAELEAEGDGVGPSLRRVVIATSVIIAVGFGGFFTWAFTASLDSAIPAMGSLAVESKRKTVSLLEPGVLKDLLVHEGQRVEAGQPLLRLDETQAVAALGSLKVQRWTAVSRLARLKAEQADASDIVFPPDLLAAAGIDAAVAALVENDRNQFADRKAAYEGSLAVQRKKIEQLKEQIGAFQAQARAARDRLDYAVKELDGVNQLLAKGFATKTRYFQLKRDEAEQRGNLGELTSKEAEARQGIAQTELEMQSTTQQRRQDISKDLQDAQAAAADLAEKIRGAEDVLAKRVVFAPAAGTVTDIKLFTPGSAIGSGQPILDIVPDNDRLLVEANVRPDEIEHVQPGQRVNVRLTSYKQHKVPVLTGKLTYVSADRQQDAKGEPYFLARAEIDPEALAMMKGVALYPGMPAEVLIIGGERKAIDYFISPITDSLHRSLREQ